MTKQFLLLPVVIGALCLSLGAAASPRDPKSMVLQLSDLPTGFGLDGKPAYVSAASAVAQSRSTTLAEYKKWGYLNGYEVNYKSTGQLGATNIESVATVYATKAGSVASTADARRACAKAPFTRLSVGATLGDESMLCTATTKSGSTTVRLYAVLWRLGALRGEVIVGGHDGAVSPAQAVRLAEKQAARMH